MHGGSSPGSLPILKGSFEELCAFGTDHREGDRPPGVSVKQERCLSRPAAVLRAGSKPHSGKGQDPTWRRRGLYPGFRSAPSPPPPPPRGGRWPLHPRPSRQVGGATKSHCWLSGFLRVGCPVPSTISGLCCCCFPPVSKQHTIPSSPLKVYGQYQTDQRAAPTSGSLQHCMWVLHRDEMRFQ